MYILYMYMYILPQITLIEVLRPSSDYNTVYTHDLTYIVSRYEFMHLVHVYIHVYTCRYEFMHLVYIHVHVGMNCTELSIYMCTCFFK